MNFVKTWLALGGVVTAAALCGCETLGSYRAAEEARWREDLRLVQEDSRKLEGRIEGLEIEVERIGRSLENLRGEQSRLASSQLQQIQSRLNDLEARISKVDAAREKDKQEIIDRLSAKIAEIMARSAPTSRGGTSGAAATPQKKPSQKAAVAGYEHEVKPGETLSAIAAAYGVPVKVILDNNDIKDPNRLRVGQKLFIPE